MNASEIEGRIRVIADRLREKYHAESVILFGSTIKGNTSEDSDTDLFIVAPSKERFFERSATVLGMVRDLYPGLALSPIVLTPKELRDRLDRDDPFVKQVMENGVRV